MWPNDAMATPSVAPSGPSWRRPGTPSSIRSVRGRHERLLGPDRQVQGRGLPDLQHVPDPSGLRDVLEAGRPTGLHPEDRPDRQDGPVSVADRGARRPWPGAGERRILDAHVPVRIVVPGNLVGRPGEWLHHEHGTPVEPGPRNDRRAVRCRHERDQCRDRPEGQDCPRGCHRETEHHDPDRQDRLHVRALPECLTGPHHRWAADDDPTGKFKVDFSIVENATDPNVPIAGKLVPYRS